MEPFTVLLTILIGASLIYYVFFRNLSHFNKFGVLHDPPLPILGNMAGPLFRRISHMEYLQRIYRRCSDVKYFGFFDFMTPVVVIRDLDLINTIAVKNFDNFCDHRDFVDPNIDPLMGKNLFSLRGDYWREMRKILSPSFTLSKMKMMFGLMHECAENFVEQVLIDLKNGNEIEMKEIACRYANDVVASCAFGIEIDSMKNPNNEFYTLGREALNFAKASTSIKFMVGTNFPSLIKLFGVRIFDQNVYNFFKNVVKETVTMRDKKGFVRPDMIQLMMESREKGLHLNIDEMTCQAFIFFLGGFDTTSSFVAFLIHGIAVNPDVQKRLREEIEKVHKETNGKPTYEAIQNMKYLEAAMEETLRLYPPAHFLNRICVKDYELPPASPGARPIPLKPGDVVWFPVYSIHRDPNYFPDPDTFNPDRFLKGGHPDGAFMPFGVGPRFCIGNRFALMEAKILVYYFLLRSYFEPCEKTSVPMVLSKKTFAPYCDAGFWVKCRPRNVNESKA